MTINDIQNNLSLIDECELIRIKNDKNSNSFILTLTMKLDEDEIVDNKEDNINGRLVKVNFKNIKNLILEGVESDNYTLLESKYNINKVYLYYRGHNFSTNESSLKISFEFSSYTVEDLGLIDSPCV